MLRSPIQSCIRCAYVCIVHVIQCIVIHTVLCAAYGIATNSLWKYMYVTCNCWNNSLWNHLSAKPGKQMSLEFPGIISLQIQVTTKDFESWIHYWTIPLKGKFPQTTMWIGWVESTFRNPTIKFWANLDNPFKKTTMPSCVCCPL